MSLIAETIDSPFFFFTASKALATKSLMTWNARKKGTGGKRAGEKEKEKGDRKKGTKRAKRGQASFRLSKRNSHRCKSTPYTAYLSSPS